MDASIHTGTPLRQRMIEDMRMRKPPPAAGGILAAAAQDFARQTAHDIVQRGQHFLDALKRGAIRCREPAAEHVFRLAQQAAAKRWIDNSFCDDLTSQILGFREFGCHVLLLSQG